jgi:hypothetical protein
MIAHVAKVTSDVTPITDSAASPHEVLSTGLQHYHGLSSEDPNASGRTRA